MPCHAAKLHQLSVIRHSYLPLFCPISASRSVPCHVPSASWYVSSCLHTHTLNLKSRPRQLTRLGLHRRINSHARQRAPYYPARKPQKRLCPYDCLSARFGGHAGEGLEGVVGEDVDAAVVGF